MSRDKCYVPHVDSAGHAVMATNPTHLNFTFQVARGVQRFRELIVYISEKSRNDPCFGAVKLNKILYYSDFRAFELFGAPLTGVRYFRLPKGPAPKALIPIQNELVAEGAIRIEKVQYGDFEQHRTIPLRRAVIEIFTEDEIILVDKVINDLWQQNATEVSDASHDVRWRTLRHKDPMPYEFAFLSDEITVADVERTKQLASELGW
jgi:Protein of unknown function (DUF4065)